MFLLIIGSRKRMAFPCHVDPERARFPTCRLLFTFDCDTTFNFIRNFEDPIRHCDFVERRREKREGERRKRFVFRTNCLPRENGSKPRRRVSDFLNEELNGSCREFPVPSDRGRFPGSRLTTAQTRPSISILLSVAGDRYRGLGSRRWSS